MRLAALLSLLLVLGCGSDAPAASGAAASDSGAAASAETYSAAVEDDPCSLLPASVAADALGVPEGDVTRNEAVMGMLSGLCAYEAAGTDRSVSLTIDAVLDDPAEAEERFARMYRALSADEIDNVADAANEAKADMDAEGTIDPTASETIGDTGAGDIIAGMAANVRFEPVDGIGDQAVVSYFRDTFDGVSVRHGNLLFSVSADVATSIDEMQRNREPSLAVARGIVAN